MVQAANRGLAVLQYRPHGGRADLQLGAERRVVVVRLELDVMVQLAAVHVHTYVTQTSMTRDVTMQLRSMHETRQVCTNKCSSTDSCLGHISVLIHEHM